MVSDKVEVGAFGALDSFIGSTGCFVNRVCTVLIAGLWYLKISQLTSVLKFHPRMSRKCVTTWNHRPKPDSILGHFLNRNMGYVWQFRME